MRKRKNKKTIAKLGLLFTILLISLASISMSYAAWTDTITIEGTITTGEAHNETAWARMYEDPDDFTYEFPGSNWATYIINQSTEEPTTFYLYAAQHYRAGELYVWKDEDDSHLYVEYDLDDGYTMSKSHLHVNTSLEGIPQNNGNPPPGQFDYSEDHNPRVTEYTYGIPWDSAWDGIDLYIAAHAIVWIWGICP